MRSGTWRQWLKLRRTIKNMKNIRNKAISIIFSSIVFSLFFLFFKFEKNSEAFSNIVSSRNKLENVMLQKVVQRFKLDTEFNTINKIAISLFNPFNRKIICDFSIRPNNSAKTIVRKEIVLKMNTNIYNVEDIYFPTLGLKYGDIYCFELKSRGAPFYIPISAQEYENKFFKTVSLKNASKGSLLFSIAHQQKISIISYLFRQADGKTRLLCLVLMVLSFLMLLSASFSFLSIKSRLFKDESVCSPYSPVDINRKNLQVLLTLFLFIFLLIMISFSVGSNTYSKLLGAEDDAFITYKYARNISGGQGFCFNPGEKVLGTSTPLYTILLSFFGLFTGKLHFVSLMINLISILFSGIIIYTVLSKYIASWLALTGGIMFIFFPMFYRVMGMETNFFIFLFLWGIYLFSEKKTNLSFFIIGMATLTRIEAVLFIPLLSFFLLYRKEFTTLLKALGIYVITILPWFVFSYYYFGNLLPNTFYIKTIAGYDGQPFLGKIVGVIERIITLQFLKTVFLSSFISFLKDYIQYYYIWVLLFVITFILSLKYLYKIKFAGIFFFFVLSYIFALAVLNLSPFIWYYVAAMSIIPFFLTLGLSRLFTFFEERLKANKVLYLIFFMLFLLVSFEGRNVYNFFYGQWYARHMPNLERYETYLEISDFVNRNISPDKTIAMEEIGIVGYYTRNKILDLWSLIHKAGSLPYRFPGDDSRRIPYFLTLMDPDYVILISDRFMTHIAYRNYQEVKRFPVKKFQSDPEIYYLLLKKRDDRIVVLGDVRTSKSLTGKVEKSGWVFGTEAIKSVEVLVDDKVISAVNTFQESSTHFQKKFNFNRFRKNAFFNINLDTAQMDNGEHEVVFRASTGAKTGVFWREKLVFRN